MPIHIAESPEPVNDGSSLGRSTLAESVAYHRLSREIERYVRGDVQGRSFLISGHRGSGKTTLVLSVIQDMQARFRDSDPYVRLVPITLYGPDLLPPQPDKAPTPPAGNQPAAPVSADPADAGREDTLRVLRHVTIAIYRTIARECVQAYRTRVEDIVREGIPPQDLHELAAQLSVELESENPPGLARLRQFWDRVDGLDHGVLFPRGDQPGHGLVELTAIARAVQAYRVVSGKFESKVTEKLNEGSKLSVALETVSEIKNAVTPLLALLTGGAVGVGVGAKTDPTLGAIAGIAAAVTVGVTLKYSASRSRDVSLSQETSYLPDYSIASLGRLLPPLIRQLRDAGVTPIFVVDELDKVGRFEERMPDLVKNLKYFVTERSFFCFLTDRSYFERVGQLLLTSPYPEVQTYFTDRLLVVYGPGELHEYLKRHVLSVEDQTGSDRDALDVLRYVLLQRARLHPFDLRRELTRLRRADGRVSLDSAELVTHLSYRYGLLIQVAIEWLLRRPELRQRLVQDPDFAQRTYDSLYYPLRMWERKERELDASRATFFAYLRDRGAPLGGGVQDGSEGAGDEGQHSRDEEFLYNQMRGLLFYLREPGFLRDELLALSPPPFELAVISALPIDGESRLLAADANADHYVWQYDIYGHPIVEPTIEQVLSYDLEAAEALIDRVVDTVQAITEQRTDLGSLAVDFKVLAATPAWPEVVAARQRLKSLRDSKHAYSSMTQDASTIREYASLLRTNSRTLALAFALGAILGRLSARQALSDQVVEGLRVLSSQLALAKTHDMETLERLRASAQSLAERIPALSEGVPDLSQMSPAEWQEAVGNFVNHARPGLQGSPQLLSADCSTAWDTWRERFTMFLESGKAVFDPQENDLLCAASEDGPGRFLKLDLTEVSLAAWTEALAAAVDTDGATAKSMPVPLWLGVPALVQLGFGVLAKDYVESVRRADQPDERRRELERSQPDVNAWLAAIERTFSLSRPVRTSVLVVTPEQGGLTRDWKPSLKYAALLASLETLKRLLEALARLGLVPKELRGVLVEGSGADVDQEIKQVNEAIVRPFARWIPPELKYRYLSPQRLPASMPSNVDAALVSPASSFDDVVAAWLT
jgi:hypothetical protein